MMIKNIRRRVAFAASVVVLTACGARVDPSNAVDVGTMDAADAAPVDAMNCPVLEASAAAPALDLSCAPGDTVWEHTCGGVTVITHDRFVDCSTTWVFDATTNAFLASFTGCNTMQVCQGAVPGFVFPSVCSSDPSSWTNLRELCNGLDATDAGVAPPG